MKKLDTHHKCLSLEHSMGQDWGKRLALYPELIPYSPSTHQKQNDCGSRLFRVAEHILLTRINLAHIKQSSKCQPAVKCVLWISLKIANFHSNIFIWFHYKEINHWNNLRRKKNKQKTTQVSSEIRTHLKNKLSQCNRQKRVTVNQYTKQVDSKMR